MDFSDSFLSLLYAGRLSELFDTSSNQSSIEAHFWEIFSLLLMNKTPIAHQKLSEFSDSFSGDLWLARLYFLKGFYLFNLDPAKSKSFYDKSFSLMSKINSKLDLANYHLHYAMLLHNEGEPNWPANLETGLSFASDVNYIIGKLWYHQVLAEFDISSLQFDIALSHLRANEHLCKAYKNDFFLSTVFSSYGDFFSLQKDFKRSVQYYEQALSLATKTQNNWVRSNVSATLEGFSYKKSLHP